MSRHDYSYIGFGIPVDNLSKCTLEGVKALVNLCDDETKEQVAELTTLDEFLAEEFDTYESGLVVGVPALLIEAIRLKENIRLLFASNDYERVIIYEPVYSWHLKYLTEEEKALTEDSLNELFVKYQKMLGINDSDIFSAGYQTIVGYC